MAEFNDPTNVIRLPGPGFTPPSSAHEEEAALRDRLSELLADAEPVATAEPDRHWLPAAKPEVVDILPASRIETGPEPGHRNAIRCPQCDHWAWRATDECWHCHYNILKHTQRIAKERQEEFREYRRKELSQWAFWLACSGIAMIYFSPSIPDPFGSTLVLLGLLAIFCALVCSKAIPK